MGTECSSGEVTLRDVLESDIPLFHAYERDPVANQMAAFPPRDWERFSAHWQKLLANRDIGKQTISLDGQVVGGIVSWGEVDEREVGYWIDRAHWGKGVATRALALYLDYEQRRPLFAHVAKHNIGSIRVLQKCGFATFGEETIPVGNGGDGVTEVILVLNIEDETEK
jgi:RimJ/RimL family protein N-acetyltransferase